MYYLISDGIAATEHMVTESFDTAERARAYNQRVLCRNDLGCMAEARAMALHATQASMHGKFLPVDMGEGCHPRYDIVRVPEAGDEVSYGFNGDVYSCGRVTQVSTSGRRVMTDEGQVFYRLRETSSWKYNKTWSLVQGHHDERNPSF